FWFFATVFIFILTTSWVGLIPGVGTIGRGHATVHGFKIDQPWFRGANADVNMTLAMALVFFACWIFWALRENGPGGFLKELFAPKGETSGLLKVVLAVVFFASGLLEIISIFFGLAFLAFDFYATCLPARRCWKSWLIFFPPSAGCYRFRFTSWNCWWVWFRPWSLCC